MQKQRRLSPQKPEAPRERWKFSATSKAFNTGDDASPAWAKRNNRAQSRALPEIKEENKEIESPPVHKDGLRPTPAPAAKKPKPAMVDAVTQTDRSDYYTLKMRALKRQLKQQKAELPTRPRGEHLVKLRIANIQLHDGGASAGPKSGAYHP